jgi:ATP-binding cassette, subfamily B, bacterial
MLRGIFGRFTSSGGQGGRSALVALRTFLPFVRPHWRGFIPAVIGVIAVSLVALLKPWPLKFLIDDVLQVGQTDPTRPASPATIILAIAGAIVGIAALQGLFNYLKEFFLSATSQRVAFSVRRALFAHMQRLSLTFHDRQHTGDMITRVTNDVTKVQELVTDKLLADGISSVLQFAGMLAVMFVIDWRLGLIAGAWAPLVVIASTYFRGRIRDEEQHVRQREGNVTSLAQETISSIRVVKAFGRERFADQRFAEQTGEMAEGNVNVARLEARFAWVMTLLTACGLATLVAFGAWQVLAGALSAGTLVVFIQYMKDLQSPLNTLSRLWAQLAKVAVRAERIMEVFDERPAVDERPGAETAPRFWGEVRFEGVSFGYGPDQPVLRDISFEIKPGQTVAIVGATGAGKSTLASLLLRLYDPTEGHVLVDGRDIRDYKLDSLLDQVSIVLQESLLFQTTIRENIAYGRPGATMEEIREAARNAYCDEFIRRLPEGYDTVVGERGGTLSGGQRQRIAIARAIVRDSPVLILDEPTAGLDAEAEAVVMRALERLMSGRTTLMIAHKLSTVSRADRIYVLKGGEIIEEGAHEELAARGGAYARAFRLQTISGQDVG